MIFTSHIVDVAQIKTDLDSIMGAGFDTATDSLVKIRDEQTVIEGAGFNYQTDALANLQAYVMNIINQTSKLNFTGANLDVKVIDKGILNNVSVTQVNTEVDNALNTAIPSNSITGSVNDLIKNINWFNRNNPFTYTIGDDLIHSNDTEASAASSSYVKVKETECEISGTIRIKFDMKRDAEAGNRNGRIYKNGVALGTARNSDSDTYITYSEDLVFDIGDTIEVWVNGTGAPRATLIRNFRIYGEMINVFKNTME